MALHERAAAGVLPGEPDRGALQQQGAEGHQFPEGPVHVALHRHLRAALEEFLEFGVDGETLRRPGVGLADAGEHVRRCGGDRKSTRLNSSHVAISYAVFCLKKKKSKKVKKQIMEDRRA